MVVPDADDSGVGGNGDIGGSVSKAPFRDGGFTRKNGGDPWVPREAYLRRARLRISGAAGGTVEACAAGMGESDGNASVFTMKLEFFFVYPTPIFGVFSLYAIGLTSSPPNRIFKIQQSLVFASGFLVQIFVGDKENVEIDH
ncbi:hypothetical protein U1Q18_017120 [Sarracenia purpurea var. burkii]